MMLLPVGQNSALNASGLVRRVQIRKGKCLAATPRLHVAKESLATKATPRLGRIAMAMKAMTRPMTAAKTAKVQKAMKVVKKLVAMKAAKAAATPKAPVKKKPAALATKAIVDTLLFIRSVDGRMHYVGMGGYFD